MACSCDHAYLWHDHNKFEKWRCFQWRECSVRAVHYADELFVRVDGPMVYLDIKTIPAASLDEADKRLGEILEYLAKILNMETR